jgi:hypothetical protein
MPTAVVRQREIDTPCSARKAISWAPLLERAHPRVNAEYKAVPVRKVIRRLTISAVDPASRRVQPHVSLYGIVSSYPCLKVARRLGVLTHR